MKNISKLFALSCTLIICFTFQSYAKVTKKISVKAIGDGFYIHTSYKTLNGKPIGSNGMFVVTGNRVILIDTPWDEDQTKQLLKWIDKNIKKPVTTCIITHAHDDRMAGISVLHEKNILTFSSQLTAKMASDYGLGKPKKQFSNDTTFSFLNFKLETFYPGEGHTKDNIVVWFPVQKILYGGCFVKATKETDLGYTKESNLKEWPNSLKKVKEKYPTIEKVIVGHGEGTDKSALDKTILLLQSL